MSWNYDGDERFKIDLVTISICLFLFVLLSAIIEHNDTVNNKKKYGHPKIAMVGLQPRMVESLSKNYEIKVTDMDFANINADKFGVIIQSPQKTKEHLEWCDIAIVTGSTIVNGTITDFLSDKPVIFYGITISGAAKVLGLEDFCYCGK